VVALGFGAGGVAAVLAAASPARTTRDGANAAGLAAAASLGPGPALFVLGGADRGRDWPARAERLCGVLAAALAGPSEARRAEAECRRALLEEPPGAAP
jgi:hypothetical protein